MKQRPIVINEYRRNVFAHESLDHLVGFTFYYPSSWEFRNNQVKYEVRSTSDCHYIGVF